MNEASMCMTSLLLRNKQHMSNKSIHLKWMPNIILQFNPRFAVLRPLPINELHVLSKI